MRWTPLAALLGVLFLSSADVQAQQRANLKVSKVRVGFPAGNQSGEMEGQANPLFKAGAWTPVWVDIQVGPPGLKGTEGRLEVTIETPDADDVQTNYTVNEAMPELGPGGTFTVMAYTKVGTANCDIGVTLRGPDGQVIGQPYKLQHNGMNPGELMFLTVGSRMSGLRQAFSGGGKEDQPALISNNRNDQVAYADKIQDLPEHWFGYNGVDLLILSTSRRNDFLMEFASPRQKRRVEALAEWVERGGNIIISVGKNQDVLAGMPELNGPKGLLPVVLKRSSPVADLNSEWGTADVPLAGTGRAAIELAQMELKPGRPVRVLLRRNEKTLNTLRDGEPVIVQAPFGVGRVTVVGFDLDQKPFADWKGQSAFWGRLLEQCSDRDLTNPAENMVNRPFRGGMFDDGSGPELIAQMQSYLENFEEVPVISFGWVALFILIYILVVGPLDYFFLKKVVKRLELTWITFPTVVLVVSAVAYFTAYQIKGNDLRIRKLDLVDVDLHTQEAYGHTWFTLFSPRIQHYTIGVEPAAPDWTVSTPENTPPNVVVSWMDRPQTDFFGRQRSRGQSLFRRAYDYEPNATGLKGVPIQVWSTKSFTASWQAALSNSKPLFAASLRHPPANTEALSGEITWRPGETGKAAGELQDVYLIYNGKVKEFPLQPGTPSSVNTVEFESKGKPLNTWLQVNTPPNQQVYNRGRWTTSTGAVDIDLVLRSAMFNHAADRTNNTMRNNSLRFLDGTWRTRDNKDEAILVARMVMAQGQADDVTQSATSATRLWLGSVPGTGGPRPSLGGTLRQETYVRVFIPVQPK
ncbi:MAG: hypothetical protein K2R98_27685 [Gemmataceae bacterium]|nr:hypothetical protein [Gemmataceae bacterium]